jgi:hypothetical protein
MKGKKKLIDATKTLADLEIDGSTRLICVVRLMNVSFFENVFLFFCVQFFFPFSGKDSEKLFFPAFLKMVFTYFFFLVTFDKLKHSMFLFFYDFERNKKFRPEISTPFYTRLKQNKNPKFEILFLS